MKNIIANNDTITKSIETLYAAKSSLYEQASAASEKSVQDAIYAAIDSIDNQCTALEAQRLDTPKSDAMIALESELA